MLRLEPKEQFDTGDVQAPRARTERIGPYTVVRDVARAPGARLVEAEGPGDTRVLLQVVRLRAPADEADRVARQRYERGLGARTAALFDEPDLEIRAQGGADVSDGTRWVYWARAWSGAPVDPSGLSGEEIFTVARDLLRRLARRHGRGRAEPLLSERALWRAPDGTFGVAGVPVGVERAWMAASEDPARRALDESPDGEVGGDLWRLGEALRALTAGREVPDGVRTLLASLSAGSLDLTATEPQPRASSAADALRALGAEAASDVATTAPTPVASPTPPAPSARTSTPSPAREGPHASWADAVSAPRSDEVTSDLRARRDAVDPIDAATTRIELAPATPPVMAVVVRAPIDSAELATLEASQPHESSTDPALGAAEAVTRQTRALEPAPPSSPAIVPLDPSEQNTSTQRTLSFSDTVLDGKALPRLQLDGAAVDPAAVAWAPALLPEGASPWSEVVRARPARPTFTGFPGELPELGPDDVNEPTTPHALMRASEPPGPLVSAPAPVVPLASPPTPVGLTPARRLAVAAGATLLVLGLVALWSRGRDAPIEALDGLVVTAVNEVTLDAQPAGATVIAEADGRILGTTPMRFVVPPAADAAVLLTRPGFDPQRLVLPDRGGIVAVLTPLSTTPCAVDVEVVSGGAIEGVGAEIGAGPRFTIPGAAVVRVKGGKTAGARIVRCPEAPRDAPLRLRFGAPNEPAVVRITHPAGTAASIEGTEVGVVPAARSVASAFARVRVGDASGAVVERWVPSRSDVEVQMPTAPRGEATPPPVVDATRITVIDPAPEPRDRPAGEPRREGTRAKAEALSLLREGTELLQAGHADTARSRLQACLRADPTAAACHRGLAEVFRREDSATEARAHYERYLALAPDAPDAALVRSLIRQLQ